MDRYWFLWNPASFCCCIYPGNGAHTQDLILTSRFQERMGSWVALRRAHLMSGTRRDPSIVLVQLTLSTGL